MPIYVYRCEECGFENESRAPVMWRECWMECPRCKGKMRKQFTPTANLIVPSHFRVNQRDLLPPKGDPAWEGLQMGGESQIKERPSAGEQLARELERA